MPRARFAVSAMFAISLGSCLGYLATPHLCSAQQAAESDGHQPAQSASNTATAVSSATPIEDLAAEQALLDLTNQRRREAGAPPLRMEASLTAAARAHAKLMVDRQQLSHHFDGEPLLMPRLLETGLRLDHVGENVAFNGSAEKAFEALMDSPPHRRNLLDPDFNTAGFAAFWSGRRLYVVQDFAHRLATVSPTSAP